ncbi:protein SCO1/2 [Salinimicrobium sediminis]|uniref:Protein SCO1/2 n=2 Tax=Salinimicrobium sediminis TaxID=1343891 RepID=A0A285X4S5_9FLAO|nr:protein SCO1/2 [Salinimicrobium sediminis]
MTMKNLIYILLAAFLFTACNNAEKKETEVENDLAETKVSAENKELPELSIYNLPSTWTTQNGENIQLEDLRGNVLVMVMIYTSCKAACPRLVADMRNIEKQVPEGDLDNVKFIMVSIDPETDTPKRLKEFSIENDMEDDHWLFLRGTPEDTREFATVLAVSYKKISPIDFSHSNIISVFDEEGVLVHQQEGLGVDNTETIQAITTEVSN